MPKISIILPIFNVEKYLNRCVDSVISQTLEDIEIILATDGPESCDKICEEYAIKDSRVKIVSHPGSYGKAFNKSLEIASGEYIGIVETDDWCDNTMFEKMYNKAKENDADVVKAGFYFAYDDENKNTFEVWDEYNQYLDIFKNQKFLASQPSVWSCIYKKDFLIKNNIKMIEDRMAFIDAPFHYETLYKADKYVLLKEPLYYYYQDNENQTVRNVKPLDGLRAEKYAFEKIKESNNFEKLQKGFINSTSLHLLWNYKRMKFKDKITFWKNAREYVKTLPLNKGNCEGLGKRQKRLLLDLKRYNFYLMLIINSIKSILSFIFSIRNKDEKKDIYKQIRIFGIKIKFLNVKNKIKRQETEIKRQETEITQLKKSNFYLILNNIPQSNINNLLNMNMTNNIYVSTAIDTSEMKLFSKIIAANILTYNKNSEADAYLLWGTKYWDTQYFCAKDAYYNNKPLYVIEDGFIKSIASPWDKHSDMKYRYNCSYTINSSIPYFNSLKTSLLEELLNDENLVINEEQKNRAKANIDKIISNNITKYNHQPIFVPNIGRKNVRKILVVDQSYGDMAISTARANDETFFNMLNDAIKENPDADIIVKTHPDTLLGAAKGYYTSIKQQDNVYPYTEAINPISLINYCDEVYVCSSQMGFEALLCGKKVHSYGVSFYSNYGLTIDKQYCERRKVKRTLEEMFYIIYIMFSYYVNPDTECKCELEDIIDYVLDKRKIYFEERMQNNA